MRLVPLLLLALALAACAPVRTPAPAEDAPVEEVEVDTTVATAPDTAAAPEPEPLYRRTDEQLRQALTDALFNLYRIEADPAAARRMDAAAMDAWLADLQTVSPRAAGLARQEVGDVLEDGSAVGYLYADVHPDDCAREDDVLFVAVPESMQGETRVYDGFLVRDACALPAGTLCNTCVGAAGSRPDGTRCACVCTAGTCPGTACVTC